MGGTKVKQGVLDYYETAGAVGVDISPDQIKGLVEKIQLYETGYASLVYAEDVFVGDKYADSVGEKHC